MKEKYYCPDCHEEVEVLEACGSSSYFCNNCKKLISGRKVLTQTDKEKSKKLKLK